MPLTPHKVAYGLVHELFPCEASAEAMFSRSMLIVLFSRLDRFDSNHREAGKFLRRRP